MFSCFERLLCALSFGRSHEFHYGSSCLSVVGPMIASNIISLFVVVALRCCSVTYESFYLMRHTSNKISPNIRRE